MQSQLTPQQFVERWRNTELSERASYQMHFADLCRLIGYETPDGSGTNHAGDAYAFEYSLKKTEGTTGFADVYLAGKFAIEYKAPGKYKDLRAAYDQLLQYREQLDNPPLLIVTDIQNWEIHTNWTGTEKRVYSFTHEEIATRTMVQGWLQNIFHDPKRLHPKRNAEQVTADAARAFEVIANNMRDWQADPERIAHFLTKLVFCLFAEDVSLLPSGPSGDNGIFSEIIERTRDDSARFIRYTEDLFKAMADGGDVLFQRIPWFDGSLFDDVRVEELSFEALTELQTAAKLNWESVEPAIFGTLFERSLDPSKRSQLGAHYTSREDILLIVEPVLMRPLERQWEQIQAQAEPIRAKLDEALSTSNRRNQTMYQNQLIALREDILKSLREVTVLDPACGSGNFLYVALQRLMDMEKEVIKSPLFAGLPEPFPEVHPRQMYGMEINPIAHSLASIVVWIGYLQWRRTNGYMHTPTEPILEPLGENIRLMDAILTYDEAGNPIEPQWVQADIIIGNPPFLGGQSLLSELGESYANNLRYLYRNALASVDLVCYWFEQSRKQIEADKSRRAGLLSTQSIRAGANRDVLKRIKETGDIFMAWSDREWSLDGASVRVSMIGFDDGSESEKILDGVNVDDIHTNLTSDIDITKAIPLRENQGMAFQGPVKVGAFDIDEQLAYQMLKASPNNQDVIKPLMNGSDIADINRKKWIIDFNNMSEDVASQYAEPFAYVEREVKPKRLQNSSKSRRTYWWRLGASGTNYRNAMIDKTRQIFTPRVAKHRIFVMVDSSVFPDSRIYAIARQDSYFFGVLHSNIHELWSLRQASWHGKGNDPTYNAQSCFETFPFPWSPGTEPTDHPAYQAIASAAKQLHEERDAWLNPPGISGKALKDRTLTNLYNALNVFRGTETIKIKPDAGDFAPRLAELHDTLDRAVCDAYGWSHAILDDEEAILSHLLELNLQRAKNQED